MQDARLNELKMPSIAADAAEARCLIEEHFKVHIKLLRQDKGGVLSPQPALQPPLLPL